MVKLKTCLVDFSGSMGYDPAPGNRKTKSTVEYLIKFREKYY
jgi:hypothetical protein